MGGTPRGLMAHPTSQSTPAVQSVGCKMLDQLITSQRGLLRAALYDEAVLASGKLPPEAFPKLLAWNADPALRLLALKVLRRAIYYEEYNAVVAENFGSLCRVLLLTMDNTELRVASELLAELGRAEEHRGTILFHNQMLRDVLTQRPIGLVQRGLCAMMAWTMSDHYLDQQVSRVTSPPPPSPPAAAGQPPLGVCGARRGAAV